MRWKYANYQMALLIIWRLTYYIFFELKTPTKSYVFGAKIPFNRCQLRGKSMQVEGQKHDDWEAKAYQLSGKSMIIGNLYGVNVPQIDYLKVYMSYFSILFCQRKRIHLTNKRFINIRECRCQLCLHTLWFMVGLCIKFVVNTLVLDNKQPFLNKRTMSMPAERSTMVLSLCINHERCWLTTCEASNGCLVTLFIDRNKKCTSVIFFP